MQKCLNCVERAHYTVKNPGASAQYFCMVHLPKFINVNKLPDHVTLFTPEVPRITNVVTNPEVEEVPVKPKKKAKAAAPVAEEPVVEEAPAVEEAPVEE